MGPPRLGVGVHLYPCYLSAHAILWMIDRDKAEIRRGVRIIIGRRSFEVSQNRSNRHMTFMCSTGHLRNIYSIEKQAI